MKKKTWKAAGMMALIAATYVGVALANEPNQDCGAFWIWDPFGWFCNIL
ncbi:hypothetical protein ACFOED_10195 [Vulcaniibacterium thermophilum]|uniref:Uncharacterized protein n=1 Tax=Vulcaniibacterium thermophilum TaxID=1169913 RepID=A0A918YW54_9GAMM|nr:hypothetical protein [Vulcaniibacterium thermophilum]GHE26790.1 hypothetical protein GCM10007167_04840 [Vulcaniibacterium thermophilum]